jgi:hypothetical protein
MIALPRFAPPTPDRGDSAAVHALDEVGADGWEAVDTSVLPDGTVIVLLKRPREDTT